MTKDELGELFDAQLERAAQLAEARLNRRIPRSFRIRFFGPGHPAGEPITRDAALDALYLDAQHFFRIVDLAVVRVRRTHSEIFARVSGDPPASFEQTWNAPPGSGPFKQLVPEKIEFPDE